MARTKASVGIKVASGKSSKATAKVSSLTTRSSGRKEKSSLSSGGGNPVCPRETPKWQKPITSFFAGHQDSRNSDDEAAGSSKPKPKKRIIESDDETSPTKSKNEATPKETDNESTENSELDESIELEPLTGENSHKIKEYYQIIDKKDTKDVTDIKNSTANDSEKNEQNADNKTTDKGKGIGKKTRSTKQSIENDDIKNSSNESASDPENTDKENMDCNKTDKDSNKVGRKKREREDEEGNISKKVKVI